MDKTFEILLVIFPFFLRFYFIFGSINIKYSDLLWHFHLEVSLLFFKFIVYVMMQKNYSLWNIILCTRNVFLTCKGNGHKSCLLQMHQALNAYHTPNGRTHRASNSFCSYLHRLHKISLCKVNTSKQISIKGVYSASK